MAAVHADDDSRRRANGEQAHHETAPRRTPAQIDVRGLTKSYEPRRRGECVLHVLRDVNFTVSPGEFVAVIGPSGSGKSTLLNVIAGLEPPSAGVVALDGDPAAHRLGEIAYMHQRDLLLPWRTVLENGRLGLELQGVTRQDADRRTAELAAEFGLADVLDQRPWQLSGGMRQRVALLRSVLPGRRALLLDEPFGALDAITRSGLQTWLASVLDRQETTVALVTHDVEEAILLSDRVLVLNGQPGHVAAQFDVELPRPRAADSITEPRFVGLKRTLLQALGGE